MGLADTIADYTTLALTLARGRPTLTLMEVNLRPETESRLQELAAKTGRPPNDLVDEAVAGYLKELTEAREMLDGRYDKLASGRVKPIDGEDAFAARRKSSNDARRGSQS